MHLFHYHLVTSKVRQVEARYVGKLGFHLIARYGRIGDEPRAVQAGVDWETLDRRGFKLRLAELEQGAVNVVVQPGQWELPRVDHIGIALDEDDYEDALARAADLRLRVQDHGGRRTFIGTDSGYRLEIHPPRDWLDDLLEARDEFRLGELHLRAEDPEPKAEALAQILDLDVNGASVKIGETWLRFIRGGPRGRPELHAELFV